MLGALSQSSFYIARPQEAHATASLLDAESTTPGDVLQKLHPEPEGQKIGHRVAKSWMVELLTWLTALAFFVWQPMMVQMFQAGSITSRWALWRLSSPHLVHTPS
jgi:hypothetical protein